MVCGFEFIHSQRFVHPDLWPENYLLDKYTQSCMGDLGSSRLVERVNRLSTDKSTVADVAPELYTQEYTAKVDLFSRSVLFK
jgi:serine/threonine protein kinase